MSGESTGAHAIIRSSIRSPMFLAVLGLASAGLIAPTHYAATPWSAHFRPVAHVATSRSPCLSFR